MTHGLKTPFHVEPRPGEIVRGDLWTHASAGPSDVAIVVCHGFKGFKDWGFFPHTSEQLADRLRCPVVSFNFSGCGVGADLESFSEPEAFGHNTFSKECGDLDAVLDGLASGRLGDVTCPPARRFGVLGHSRGGVAAVLSGERPDVGAVVTWAAIASPRRYAELFEDLPAGASASVTNARTGDVLPLYRDVADDLLGNATRFDLEASLRRSRVPLLVIHGTEDESVPVADAVRLAGAAGGRAELIEGTGHTFGVGHPFAGPSPELTRAIELTAGHFSAHLSAR